MKILKWSGIFLGSCVALVFLLSLYLWVSTRGDYLVPLTADQDSTLPVFELDGYKFHVQTRGRAGAPVVIVLHGGPGGDLSYLRDLDALADEYYLVYYDQRGSGLSSRQGYDEITVDDFIRDLDAIVEHYGGGRPVYLLGHSWGAMLSAAYLGRYPAKVSKAVLAEPGFLTPELGEKFLQQGPGIEAMWALARVYFKSLHVDDTNDKDAPMDFFLSRLNEVATSDYYCDGKFPALDIKFGRGGYRIFEATAARMMSDPELLKTLDFTRGVKEYPGQILIIAGECNKVIGPERQREHLKFFKNARLEVIKNSGHLMFSEQKEITRKLLREFLR